MHHSGPFPLVFKNPEQGFFFWFFCCFFFWGGGGGGGGGKNCQNGIQVRTQNTCFFMVLRGKFEYIFVEKKSDLSRAML